MTNSTVEQSARKVIQVLPNFRDGKYNQKRWEEATALRVGSK